MKPWSLLFLTLICISPMPRASGDEPVFSGPQRGEKLTPFKVFIASGTRKGQEADLIGEFAGAPTVLVFVHEITRPAAALMRPLDAFQQKRAEDGLKLGFVFLAKDRTEMEQRLPLVANSLRMATPLTLSVDGAEGPGQYGLNRNVQITALVAKDNRVTASFALVQPNETDAPKILAEVVKLIGGTVPLLSELDTLRRPPLPARDNPPANAGAAVTPPSGSPSPEEIAAVRRDLAALQAQYAALLPVLNDLRRQVAELRKETPPPPLPGAPAASGRSPLPGAKPDDPKLESYLRRLIRPEASTEEVDRAAKELAAYVGENKERQKQSYNGFVLVLHLNYGSPYAQQVMRGLQEKWRP
jgi:hypothetical protein